MKQGQEQCSNTCEGGGTQVCNATCTQLQIDGARGQKGQTCLHER